MSVPSWSLPLRGRPVLDYKDEVKKALQRARDDSRRLDRAAMRMPVSDLSVGDLATVVAELLQDQRKEFLAHVTRLFKLVETRQHLPDIRDKNFHARITQLESEIRLLKRKGGVR
jgi:hypothetical protein